MLDVCKIISCQACFVIPVLVAVGIGLSRRHMASSQFSPHRLVVAAARTHSAPPVLHYHRREPNTRSAQRVVVQDMEAAAFKAMLHFIYTDAVPELDGEQEAATTMAQHLLAAADRYGLDRLKVICEGKLCRGIAVDAAATTLAMAEQHNCSHLKAKCVEFIISTPAILDAVVATEGYKHLEASCPSALTSIVLSMRGTRN
ncbi:BTB/POZ and MATH domain-containing protein 1-like [Triticum dicoccoides]|uniref:BTB/POZ and MATH domain-containing protein 1-like n=1 Tax=Triticum dicoccoides TaxID=85692 RepID=UPI00189102C7|nr:BTB/POZ and MATH domain-containing protein 1-like [Triticum dicoccoides]